MDRKKIGIFIATLRKENNMSQSDLAQKLNVDRGTISKWERGVYIPHSQELMRISEMFNVTVNEILVGEKENDSNKVIIQTIGISTYVKLRKKLILTVLVSIFLIITVSIFIYNVSKESRPTEREKQLVKYDEQGYSPYSHSLKSTEYKINAGEYIDMYVIDEYSKEKLFMNYLYVLEGNENSDYVAIMVPNEILITVKAVDSMSEYSLLLKKSNSSSYYLNNEVLEELKEHYFVLESND